MKKFSIITKIIFILAVVFLIFRSWTQFKTNKALSATIRNLKAENRSLKMQSDLIAAKYSLISRRIPGFKLKYIDSDSFYIYPSKDFNKYLLLIFFTPLDCGTCLQEIPFWGKIRTQFQDQVTVLGIGYYDDYSTFIRFVKKEKINIPVLFDEANEYSKTLNLDTIGATPLKVLITKDGLVINLKSSTFNNPKEQDKYIERLNEIVGVND